MKKLTLLASILLLSCSQTKTEQVSQPVEVKKIDSVSIKSNEAQKIIHESTEVIAESIKGKISVKAANKKVEPMMKRYDEILKTLPASEKQRLENIRMSEANKLIDLQMRNN